MKCKWHLCKNELAGNQIKYCSRNCQNKYNVDKRRKRVKRLLVEYKGGECAICGYNKSLAAMQFHHLDPTEKEHRIGSGDTKSLEKMKMEADKCILLCANCHAEQHEIEHENIRLGGRVDEGDRLLTY